MRVGFVTFGCRLNQAETEELALSFAQCGDRIVGAPVASEDSEVDMLFAQPKELADLVVINTCTVTSKAEQKARRALRQVLLAHPGASCLVAGCYARCDKELIESIATNAKVQVFAGNPELLMQLPAWLHNNLQQDLDIPAALKAWIKHAEGSAVPGLGEATTPHFGEVRFHSRPSLKVQDGCDRACAFCRVRLARGPSVSMAVSKAIERAQALENQGHRELVLTGTNLAQYRDGMSGFAELLQRILDSTSTIALRISSLEPDQCTQGLIDVLGHKRIRPAFHLSVQSGSDTILAAMRRAYTSKDISEAVAAMRTGRTDPFISADLIVGFPGESEHDFEATMELAAECDFAWLHVFRFSPRPGTEAMSMRPRVPERIAATRARLLAHTARAGRSSYLERWMGKTVSAIIEASGKDGARQAERTAPAMNATSENFLKLRVNSTPTPLIPGSEVLCTLIAGECPKGCDAAAKLVDEPSA